MSKLVRVSTIFISFILVLGFSNIALAKHEGPQMLVSAPMVPLNGYGSTGNQHRCGFRNVTDQPIDFELTFFGYPDIELTYDGTADPMVNHGLQLFDKFEISCKIEWIGYPGDFQGTFCIYQANTPVPLYNCLKMD